MPERNLQIDAGPSDIRTVAQIIETEFQNNTGFNSEITTLKDTRARVEASFNSANVNIRDGRVRVKLDATETANIAVEEALNSQFGQTQQQTTAEDQATGQPVESSVMARRDDRPSMPKASDPIGLAGEMHTGQVDAVMHVMADGTVHTHYKGGDMDTVESSMGAIADKRGNVQIAFTNEQPQVLSRMEANSLEEEIENLIKTLTSSRMD
jgi:hypothetical protein